MTHCCLFSLFFRPFSLFPIVVSSCVVCVCVCVFDHSYLFECVCVCVWPVFFCLPRDIFVLRALTALMTSIVLFMMFILPLVHFLCPWIIGGWGGGEKNIYQDNYGKWTSKVIISLWIMNLLNGLKYRFMYTGWLEMQSDGNGRDRIYLKHFSHSVGEQEVLPWCVFHLFCMCVLGSCSACCGDASDACMAKKKNPKKK